MSCGRLAVQTATIVENVTAISSDQVALDALKSAFAATLSNAIPRLKNRYVDVFIYQLGALFMSMGDISVDINSDGSILVYGRIQAEVERVAPQITALIKAAAQMAAQNVLLAMVSQAGFRITGDQHTATARVVSFVA